MKTVILFYFCFLSLNVWAQQQDTVELKGIITDSNTKKPLAFASIGIPTGAIGTVSNDEGGFVFKVSRARMKDTLYVSSIGYNTYVLPLNTVRTDQSILLPMTPVAVALKEVVVRPLDPVKILTDALHSIATNYANQPVMMKGFYRERVWQSNELISLSEAVISIYKASYTDNRSVDQMKLLKGRRSQDVKQSDLLNNMSISGGLRVDFVKYGVHFLIPENFKYYDYQLGDILYDGKDTTLVINVDMKDNIRQPLLKGKIYLDAGSLAFTGIEYGYSPKGIQYVNEQSKTQRKAVKKLDLDVETLSAETIVKFNRRDNIWYLQSARSDYKARVKRKKRNSNDLVEYRADFIITETDKSNVSPIKKEEQLITFGVDLGRQIGKDYDPAFWRDYNYILPEESTRENIKKIQDKQ